VKLLHFRQLESLGLLPINGQEVRFAVGDPNGLTSNTWKIWEHKSSIYIACRDDFQEAKVSLHPSHWRMAFTKESNLKMRGNDRTWEEWNLNKEQFENEQIAFRLFFSKVDLVVPPELRVGKKWKNLIFIEAPPEGKLTAISIFITTGDILIKHETEPSFCLANFELGNHKWVKVIAHAEPEGNIPQSKKIAMEQVELLLKSNNIKKPEGAYAYFLGHLSDESRYLIGTAL
jgi:hypothetical protein